MADVIDAIDDVTFIIDAGRVKELMYDTQKGIAMLKETFVSRASAKQRMGRAGRVAPGVCWHLFSTARHEKMAQFQSPEILRVPLEMLCLKVKACIKSSLKESLENMITPPALLPAAAAHSRSVQMMHTHGSKVQGQGVGRTVTAQHCPKTALGQTLRLVSHPGIIVD